MLRKDLVMASVMTHYTINWPVLSKPTLGVMDVKAATGGKTTISWCLGLSHTGHALMSHLGPLT